jgi:hypothetical protein
MAMMLIVNVLIVAIAVKPIALVPVAAKGLLDRPLMTRFVIFFFTMIPASCLTHQRSLYGLSLMTYERPSMHRQPHGNVSLQNQ